MEQERLVFSIEADLHLSDKIIEAVNRQIQEMRRPSGDGRAETSSKTTGSVRERNLRYRIEIEMLPRSGILRMTDEYLAALNSNGNPTRSRKPFIERQGEKIHLRLEGQAHPTQFDRYLDRTILSMPHYPPHYPHLVAARREMESWLFFYFEPRERMRAPNPVKEVHHIGLMGEELSSYLNTLQALEPEQFKAVEKALHTMIPNIDGIEIDVSDIGEVELRLKESGVAIPSRVLSEGTLRMLGLLALNSTKNPPSLVGIEEPENGIHPRRIKLIADMLQAHTRQEETQYIVTTHSPILPDMLQDSSLFPVRRSGRFTEIMPFAATLGLISRNNDISEALDDEPEQLTTSERIIRGDFDA